jgi:OOP family OmpA-OmpF porin
VPTTLDAVGYGETKPVAPNQLNGKDNPAGRQANRRVEIFIPNS